MDVSPINSDLSIRSLVIQDYLNGISRDQTAKYRRISVNSVSNIIKNWKQEMQGSNVEEIISFSKTVCKSGISVYQCALGYRVERILNNLGIYDDDDFKQENKVEQENERKKDIYNEKERMEKSMAKSVEMASIQ